MAIEKVYMYQNTRYWLITWVCYLSLQSHASSPIQQLIGHLNVA